MSTTRSNELRGHLSLFLSKISKRFPVMISVLWGEGRFPLFLDPIRISTFFRLFSSNSNCFSVMTFTDCALLSLSLFAGGRKTRIMLSSTLTRGQERNCALLFPSSRLKTMRTMMCMMTMMITMMAMMTHGQEMNCALLFLSSRLMSSSVEQTLNPYLQDNQTSSTFKCMMENIR